MTLHVLRHTIGDDVFFELLNEWATVYAGGNVTTDQFIAMAESLSGQELDDLFQTWLFTAQKPADVDPGRRRQPRRRSGGRAGRDGEA